MNNTKCGHRSGTRAFENRRQEVQHILREVTTVSLEPYSLDSRREEQNLDGRFVWLTENRLFDSSFEQGSRKKPVPKEFWDTPLTIQPQPGDRLCLCRLMATECFSIVMPSGVKTVGDVLNCLDAGLDLKMSPDHIRRYYHCYNLEEEDKTDFIEHGSCSYRVAQNDYVVFYGENPIIRHDNGLWELYLSS
jgi:hypothetical protein